MTFANCQASAHVSAEILGNTLPSAEPAPASWMKMCQRAHLALPSVCLLIGPKKRNDRENQDILGGLCSRATSANDCLGGLASVTQWLHINP